MTNLPTVTFLNTPCRLELYRYQNGRLAIQLVTSAGEPVTTATINVANMPLRENQVVIKDYAENAGLLQALETAEVVQPTGVRCHVGYEQADICRLLIPLPAVH